MIASLWDQIFILDMIGVRVLMVDRNMKDLVHGTLCVSLLRRRYGMWVAVVRMAAAIILVGASACSVPYAEVMKSFEAAAPCCSSMAGFLYRPLSYG